ncbi:MAG: ATP-dependent zinc metalloprotease FtsH [Firmicutes bacterium]|nr:ATP-dependent zinc metalloprotease FtsH [Bacillota bacterium]
MKNKKLRVGIIYFSVILIILLLVNYGLNSVRNQEVTYSEFKQMVRDQKVEEVKISADGEIKFQIKGDEIVTYNCVATENATTITAFLEEYKVSKYDGYVAQMNIWVSLLIQFGIPLVAIFLLWHFISKSMSRGMGDAMSFGKSNAKIYGENETGITFADVAGEDEAKDSLEEIVDLLHNPQKYAEIGARLPKGALLVGPPGTGKTLLAKAVAGEAHVPFFSISGSEFVQMFVGMGAARVRDLFKEAQKKAPCIIFIDEIDAIGRNRDNSFSTNDEREQTLNQLLTEMDGFDSSKGVVILGATNRPEILDPALLRPGRFDRQVQVEIPDYRGRKAILEVHAKKVHMSSNANLDAIAKTTPGASGADLANMINEAALLAVRKGRNAVEQSDLEEALEVVIAGKIKKDRVLSQDEKRSVAYHEVGHAFLGHILPHAEEVHKITIIPRTKGALGYTMQLPGEEKYLVTKDEMLDQICSLLGGRAAEEVMLGQVSTGASNDIERATATARRMVTIYGMTDRFDMFGLEAPSGSYLDGNPIKRCSEATEKIVDEEVLDIIRTQHKRAIDILLQNREKVNEIAQYLLEKESISGEEFLTIFNAHSATEDTIPAET